MKLSASLTLLLFTKLNQSCEFDSEKKVSNFEITEHIIGKDSLVLVVNAHRNLNFAHIQPNGDTAWVLPAFTIDSQAIQQFRQMRDGSYQLLLVRNQLNLKQTKVRLQVLCYDFTKKEDTTYLDSVYQLKSWE